MSWVRHLALEAERGMIIPEQKVSSHANHERPIDQPGASSDPLPLIAWFFHMNNYHIQVMDYIEFAR